MMFFYGQEGNGGSFRIFDAGSFNCSFFYTKNMRWMVVSKVVKHAYLTLIIPGKP